MQNKIPYPTHHLRWKKLKMIKVPNGCNFKQRKTTLRNVRELLTSEQSKYRTMWQVVIRWPSSF